MQNSFYYTCNNKITYNKIEAIHENISSNSPIYFHVPDSYHKVDFSYEDDTSWIDLCKQRALQIRNNSSRLRLWFSGGCDSKFVLDLFLTNNIHIDEIITIKSGIFAGDYEIDDVAVPYLEKIKNKIPNTTITVYVPTAKDYLDFYSNPNWYDHMDTPDAMHFRLNCVMSRLIMERSQQTTEILGGDKPKLAYVNGNWYTYFLDKNTETINLDRYNTVQFFIDDPCVHRKQAQMLKKYIELNVPVCDYNKIANSNLNNKNQNIINIGCGRVLSNEKFILKQAIQDVDEFNAQKKWYSYSKKEKLALQHAVAVKWPGLEQWRKTVDDVSTIAQGKWFNSGRVEFGTIGVLSEFLCLNKPFIKTVDDLFPRGFNL